MEKKEIRREFRSTYMPNVFPDQEEGIKTFFRDLVGHPNVKRRRELFEIAGRHESLKCREWAADYIRTHTLPEYIQDFMEMWIREPYLILKGTMAKFVESVEVSKQIGLRAATYLLLDKENEAQNIDPGFEALEVFLQKDPLILAPIAERLTKIRLREFQRVVSDRAIFISKVVPEKEIEQVPFEIGSLSRALRTEDWSLAWQILKNSSFVCIAESLQFFKLSDWIPEQTADAELFLFLSEYIGFDGWDACSEILQETILDRELRYQGVKFEIAREILKPPPSFPYWLNGIHIEKEYMEGMQKNFLNVKVAGFTILYITVPSVMEIELDLIGLASLLFPISTFTQKEYDWIKNVLLRLQDSDDYYERKIQRYFLALEKLATLQSKRRFLINKERCLYDEDFLRKEKESSGIHEDIKDSYFIGFDFGNSTTAICCIDQRTHQPLPGVQFLTNSEDPAFHKTELGLYLPSLIHYRAGGKKLIGLEAKKYRHEEETFKLMKRSLRRGWSAGIKVEEHRIRAPEATKEFILQIAKKLTLNQRNIVKIGFTAPVDAPIKYQEILCSAITKAFHVSESILEVFDEATAAILGLKESIKSNTPALVVDIGGGTTDVSVISIDDASPMSKIFAKASEDIGGVDIEATAFYESREKIGLDIPKNPRLIVECMKAKHSLVNNGTMKPIRFSKNSEPVIFSIDEINSWLEKERIFEKFHQLLENSLFNAESSGSGDIQQLVLCGGGSKWSRFQEICHGFAEETLNGGFYVHDPDIFAVAKGAARGVMGFSINTLCSYPIGILRFVQGHPIFETILPKGTPIPSEYYELKITPEESDTLEVELDIRRRRIKIGGERFLLYGKNGEPFLKEGESFTIYEPLLKESKYIRTDHRNFLRIDNRGHIQLFIDETHEIKDLGSVL